MPVWHCSLPRSWLRGACHSKRAADRSRLRADRLAVARPRRTHRASLDRLTTEDFSERVRRSPTQEHPRALIIANKSVTVAMSVTPSSAPMLIPTSSRSSQLVRRAAKRVAENYGSPCRSFPSVARFSRRWTPRHSRSLKNLSTGAGIEYRVGTIGVFEECLPALDGDRTIRQRVK